MWLCTASLFMAVYAIHQSRRWMSVRVCGFIRRGFYRLVESRGRWRLAFIRSLLLFSRFCSATVAVHPYVLADGMPRRHYSCRLTCTASTIRAEDESAPISACPSVWDKILKPIARPTSPTKPAAGLTGFRQGALSRRWASPAPYRKTALATLTGKIP